MSASLPLPSNEALLPLLGASEKERDVEALILSYATGHAAMDVGIGLLGFIPIPGAGLAATVAAIGIQSPAIYKPMAKEIASIYGRNPDRIAGREVERAQTTGAIQDAAVFFGVEFFEEIARELLHELGVGLGLSIIPIVGGFVGIALDIKIAWTLTWRVGLMLALYHENGGKWIKSRKHTYELAKKFVKAGTKDDSPQPRVADFVKSVSEVGNNQGAAVSMLAETLIETGLSKGDVARKLREKGVSSELIARVMATF